jgi:tetratricopeptide (TPR) repeat protein
VARVNFANGLLSAGRLGEARAEFERYLEMTPAPDPDVAVDMARLLLLEGRNEEALAEAQRWVPGPDRDFVLAAANYALRRRADGRAAEARLRRGEGPVEAVRLAELFAHRSDADQAFAWIDAAHGRLGPNAWFSPDWQWLYQLRFSPFFRPLHIDPRWPAALERTELRPFNPVSVSSGNSAKVAPAPVAVRTAAEIGEPRPLAGITAAHNRVRATVGVPPLRWNPRLAEVARRWANACVDDAAPRGMIDHSGGRDASFPGPIGENLFATTAEVVDPVAAVQDWASEAKAYDLARNACRGPMCGHYTQLVWQGTTDVGCGVGTCPRLRFHTTLVCNYWPVGNWVGERPY